RVGMGRAWPESLDVPTAVRRISRTWFANLIPSDLWPSCAEAGQQEGRAAALGPDGDGTDETYQRKFGHGNHAGCCQCTGRHFFQYAHNDVSRRIAHMPHAIIRGDNGRRHEVGFEDAEIRVEVYSGEETVEIVVEAVNDLTSSDRRRFALLNIPKHLFSS